MYIAHIYAYTYIIRYVYVRARMCLPVPCSVAQVALHLLIPLLQLSESLEFQSASLSSALPAILNRQFMRYLQKGLVGSSLSKAGEFQ